MLAVDDDPELKRILVATLCTYLDENSRQARTARRLHIHENTVAYRLRRAQELLGRPLDERTLELRVALTLADLVAEPSGTSPSESDTH